MHRSQVLSVYPLSHAALLGLGGPRSCAQNPVLKDSSSPSNSLGHFSFSHGTAVANVATCDRPSSVIVPGSSSESVVHDDQGKPEQQRSCSSQVLGDNWTSPSTSKRPFRVDDTRQYSLAKRRLLPNTKCTKAQSDKDLPQLQRKGSMATSEASRNAKEGPRTRRTKSKRVRTGCLTCRERHLKCDEALPDCKNCQKSNRRCKWGLRLNFLDVNVHKPTAVPPLDNWSSEHM